MFLASLFRAYNFFISYNSIPILQLFRILIHIKCFSNSYVVCTSNNYYLGFKSRKRIYREINKGEFMSLPDKKIYDGINLPIIYSGLLKELKVNFENSLKNNQEEQVSIVKNNSEKYILYYEAIISYLENINRIHNTIIMCDFTEMIRNYELNKNKINKKEFIEKIEEILKKIIERSFLKIYYCREKYSALFEKIYELCSKALIIENDCNKIRSLYEILLDINFKDDISKDKKDMIINFKYYLLKTKDYDEMEKNIKKIYKDNKKYYKKTFFINFLSCFFDKEEYFILKLLKGSYKSGKYPHKLFLKDNIPKIIESYDDDKCSLVLNNISDSCLIEISEKF